MIAYLPTVRPWVRGATVPLITSIVVPAKDASPSGRSTLDLLRIPDPRRAGRADWLQLLRFIGVGITGYVVNLAVFSVVLLAGLHYIPAAIVAFAVAWTNNFVLNRHWTFRARGDAVMEQGVRYLLVCLAALGGNLIILHLLVETGLTAMVAQASAIVLVTPLSYLLSRRWSFR